MLFEHLAFNNCAFKITKPTDKGEREIDKRIKRTKREWVQTSGGLHVLVRAYESVLVSVLIYSSRERDAYIN